MIREQDRIREEFYWWDQQPFEPATYDSLSDYDKGIRFRWAVRYMADAIVQSEAVTRGVFVDNNGGILDPSDELVQDVLQTVKLQNRPKQDFIGPLERTN